MTENSRPLIPVNPKGLDDVAEGLLNNSPLTQDPDQSSSNQSPANITNPETYIILPSKTHGKYSYPTMLVSMGRTHQGKNWYDAHKALANDGNSMLTIRQYVDFLSLLKSGNVLDGKAKAIPKKKIEDILEDILAVRDPWRAEWLDADFKVKNRVLHINYEHKVDSNGKIIPKYSEPLLPCIMQDKKPGVDLQSWLTNANLQGLPSLNVKDGNIWYYYPRDDNNSVARFSAGSVWSFLYCIRDPLTLVPRLGYVSRAKNRRIK